MKETTSSKTKTANHGRGIVCRIHRFIDVDVIFILVGPSLNGSRVTRWEKEFIFRSQGRLFTDQACQEQQHRLVR